jgi:hypothetical protein
MDISLDEARSRREEVQLILNSIPYAPQIDFLIKTTNDNVETREMTRGVRPYRSMKMRVGMLIDIPASLKGQNAAYIPGMYVVYDEEMATTYSWWSSPSPGPSPGPDPASMFITPYNLHECCFPSIRANQFIQTTEYPPVAPEEGGEYPLTMENFPNAVFSMLICTEYSAETEIAFPTEFVGTPMCYDHIEGHFVIFGKLRAREFILTHETPHPPYGPPEPERPRREEPDREEGIGDPTPSWMPELKMVRPGGILCREIGATPLAYLEKETQLRQSKEEPVDVQLDTSLKWDKKYFYNFI